MNQKVKCFFKKKVRYINKKDVYRTEVYDIQKINLKYSWSKFYPDWSISSIQRNNNGYTAVWIWCVSMGVVIGNSTN